MNRRRFLATLPLALAGCSRSTPPPPVVVSDEREKLLALLANCRVPARATRTTPKPIVDVVERFPELKPLAKVTVRLHPRYGDEPAADESKLGGQFLWPEGEDWPTCPELQAPMAPVLQLRPEDAGPKFPFHPATDLFQLLWSPRPTKAGPPHAVGVWRKRAGGNGRSAVPMAAVSGFVPVPCRLFPESILELPPTVLMPQQMRGRIEAWTPAVEFNALLAAAPGTKAGGWPHGAATEPKCLTCVRLMDYLLTIDSAEWTAATMLRWKPTEDRDEDGFRRAAGFHFGKPDAAVQVYVCRRCEKWPLRAVIV